MTIIAFCGEYASGKDYLCDHLVKTQNAARLSFSDEVRRLTRKTHPWMPFDFDPKVKDLPFIHEKNPLGLTPREIWLNVGKVRNVEPNYFVNAFVDHIGTCGVDHYINRDRLYIITDFRTPEEWVYLRTNKIPVIKIERADRSGYPPNAFEDFVRNFVEYNARFINHMNGTDEFDTFFRGFLKC
jgi:hypothetical protein